MLARQQKTVWNRAGVSASWLSTRKQGLTAISSDDIYLLAKGLDCDPCDFFTPEVTPAPTPSREDREPTPIRHNWDLAITERTQRLGGNWLETLAELGDEDMAKVQSFVEFLRWEREQGR